MSNGTHQERQPFDVAWRTIDGLKVRYATGGKGGEKVVFFSPWPESIFAFAPVWEGLTKRFEVLALDLPGFGRSEARDDLFAPQKMGEFIVKAIEAFGFASVHGVGLDVGAPSVLSHPWHDHRSFAASSWVPAPRHTPSSRKES
jgi:pimeloyl-ACP methyl ester carboxylesterase